MRAFELSIFRPTDIPAGLALSKAVGWSHRPEDWKMLLPSSSGITAVSQGQVVGTALRSDFGSAQSTLNMVIVSQDMRGQGLGQTMVAALLAKGDRKIRLVATKSGRPLYEKMGFEARDHISQHQGVAVTLPAHCVADAATPSDLPAIAPLKTAASEPAVRRWWVGWRRTPDWPCCA